MSNEIQIGPWTNGINLLDPADKIKDTELRSCVNLDIDNTGTLESRRPVKRSSTTVFEGDGVAPAYLMGSVILAGNIDQFAVINRHDAGTSRIRFASNPTATAGPNYYAGAVKAGLFKSVVQYQSKIWYVPGDAASFGLGFSTSADPLSITTQTAVGTIPYGDIAFVLKDRMFVIRKAANEIHFSKATDFTIWTAPDGGVIQINPGDNQPITDVVVLNGQVIIFKREQTYVLTFSDNPTGDGTVRQVSADQGAFDAITYNNEVYCFNSRSVFKFVNGYFQNIANQLDLRNTLPLDKSVAQGKLHILGSHLILGASDTALCYAMNLDTGAWTTYQFDASLVTSLRNASITFRSSTLGKGILFGDSQAGKLSFMTEQPITPMDTRDQNPNSTDTRPTYSFQTKQFDFDDSMVWKRMYKWYLDARFTGASFGTAQTYINGGSAISITSNGDLVGNTAGFRFRRVAMGFTGLVEDATASMRSVTVRGIKGLVNIKQELSTTGS